VHITFKGKPKNTSKKLIREAMKFFADYLMTKRLQRNLHIEVVFCDGMPPGIHADAQGYYIDENTSYPKVFDININKNLRLKTLLRGIAHELTHIKQYARSELLDYYRTPELVRWKDEVYDNPAEDKKNLEAYWLAPWEIEARGWEGGLVKLFSLHMRKKGTPLFPRKKTNKKTRL